MSFCPYCGYEISQKATACPKCGSNIDGTNTEDRDIWDSTLAKESATPSKQIAKARRIGIIPLVLLTLAITATVIGIVLVLATQPGGGGKSAPLKPAAAVSSSTKSEAATKPEPTDSQKEAPKEAPKETPKEVPSNNISTPAPAENCGSNLSPSDREAYERACTEARSEGWQIFEGTLKILSGEEVAQLENMPIDLNGPDVAERWRNSEYAFLMLDEAQTIHNIDFDMNTISIERDRVCLGMREGTTDSLGEFAYYDGRRIGVACKGFSLSSGGSLVVSPMCNNSEKNSDRYAATLLAVLD